MKKADDVDGVVMLPFPKECVIKNIYRGEAGGSCYVYASLYSPEGELLISATLDYINERILNAGTAT